MVLLAMLIGGGVAAQLANPQIIRRFLDAAQAGQAQLASAGVAFIAIALLQTGLNLAAVWVGQDVGWRATNALRADLTRHCLHLDLPFHKQHTPGDLIERIEGDALALGNFFSQFAIRILGSAVLVVGVLVLMFLEDWRLGLGLALYAALTLTALGALQNVAAQRWTSERQASAELYGFVEERYGAMEDIRGSGAEAHTMNGLYLLLHKVMRTGVSAQFVAAITTAATNALFVTGYALGLALGAALYLRGAVTIGSAYVVVYYVGMLAAPLATLRHEMGDLAQARASLDRAQALLQVQSPLLERAEATLPSGPLAVEMEDVTFAYNDEGAAPATEPPASDPSRSEFALQSVTLQLAPGRVLGLLGRTGSGKSTLANLIFRLYDPDLGAIRLGGRDLRQLAFADLRGRVGMITQEVQLFGASIRDNLAFFDPGIGDARIEAALRELGFWEWVSSLPAGLDTQLGAGGQGLSAGEAQLLAFARVFLKDPGLVVLDEASSRLDPATERLLEGAIGRLLAGRTGIIVAHRLHTVQRADDILIMEAGQVVEFGARAGLAADPASRFARLLRVGLEEVLA